MAGILRGWLLKFARSQVKILAPENFLPLCFKSSACRGWKHLFPEVRFLKGAERKQIKEWSGAAVYYCIIPAESKFNYRGRSSRCTIARALLNSSGKSNSVGLHFPAFHASI